MRRTSPWALMSVVSTLFLAIIYIADPSARAVDSIYPFFGFSFHMLISYSVWKWELNKLINGSKIDLPRASGLFWQSGLIFFVALHVTLTRKTFDFWFAFFLWILWLCLIALAFF